MKTYAPTGLAALIASGMLLASLPAAAQQGSCLNDSLDKVCAQLTAQPDSVVQASRLDGQSDTFVHYTAKITGITNPTSSRRVSAVFTLTPAVDIVDFTASSGSCSSSGGTLSCEFDKHVSSGDEVIKFTAKAPLYAGASTPSTLVNTGVFGWNGRTGTVSKALSVSTTGGYTWVPPNTTVTLVTGPEASDPAEQTTAANPRWAKMLIPGRSVGFLAYLALNNSTDEDLALSCLGGMFHSGNSDGGPYYCRDIGFPHDAGVGTRWVEASVDDTVDGSFTDAPVQLTLLWDDSVVSPLQLPPSAAGQTGFLPFAVFYHAQEPQGAPASHPIRAFAGQCGGPPCLTGVQEFANGDWTATLNLSQVYDNAAADALSPANVLNLLSGLMDSWLGEARAVLPPPVITK